VEHPRLGVELHAQAPYHTSRRGPTALTNLQNFVAFTPRRGTPRLGVTHHHLHQKHPLLQLPTLPFFSKLLGDKQHLSLVLQQVRPSQSKLNDQVV
ncbi:hypothetical protein PIB30_111885, partial [Stylosanthes scabra]|nr:hypothetical protein [Stylosanthes scabra]